MTGPASGVADLGPRITDRIARVARILAMTRFTLDILPASRLMGIDEGLAVTGHMTGHAVVTELITGCLQRRVGVAMAGLFPESGLLWMAYGTGGGTEKLIRWFEFEFVRLGRAVTSGSHELLDEPFHPRVTSDVWR